MLGAVGWGVGLGGYHYAAARCLLAMAAQLSTAGRLPRRRHVRRRPKRRPERAETPAPFARETRESADFAWSGARGAGTCPPQPCSVPACSGNRPGVLAEAHGSEHYAAPRAATWTVRRRLQIAGQWPAQRRRALRPHRNAPCEQLSDGTAAGPVWLQPMDCTAHVLWTWFAVDAAPQIRPP